MSSPKFYWYTAISLFLGCLSVTLCSCAQNTPTNNTPPTSDQRVAQRQRGVAGSRPNPRLARGNEGTATTSTSNLADARRRRLRPDAFQERVVGMSLGMAIANVPSDSDVKGVLVTAVKAYSAAENAGLSPGDIIVEFDGLPVTTNDQLREIAAGLIENSSHTVTLVRDNSRMHAAVKLTKDTTIFRPTVPTRSGPLDINTLKYVLIDPKTRVLTFIGSYDPTYETGPIPYEDVLSDVLENPYPSFSLEPSDQQRAEFDKVDQMISADIARMYSNPEYCNQIGQKLVNLLLYDPSLTVDNRRFFRNMGSALGMTGDDLKRLYDAAAGKIQMSQAESFGLFARLMRGAGLPDVADAMLAFASGGTPDDIIRELCEAMHLRTQYDELAKQMIAGNLTYEKFKDEAIILSMSAICRRFGSPESEIQRRASSVRSGAQTNDIMVDYFGEQMSNFITNKAGARMLNGLVLSPELMAKLYNLPIPRVSLVFTHVPADSYLADALFRADYLLKTLCSNPDVSDMVAGHMTDQEFMQREAAKRNYDLPSGSEVGIGNRLVPDKVTMRVSPRGDVVAFQNAQVKVLSWVRETGGKAQSGPAAAFVNSVVPGYGQFLTARYDQYARVYPEWHRISEIAKCVALARWARSNNYTLVVEKISRQRLPLPREVPGFWTAVLHADQETASLTVIEEGGASFSQDEGEAWVQPQKDDTVTSEVSKQLTASVMLAEQAANTAIAGDLEAARELADKSARAMTGDIDLNMLPALSDVPMPADPAPYAAVNAELINQAAGCLDTMKNAQQDFRRAQDMEVSSPEQAAALRQQATTAQDNAQAKLKEILAAASQVKSTPSSAGRVAVALRSGASVVMPMGGVASGSPSTGGATSSTSTPTPPVQEDWPTKLARLNSQLDEVEKRIGTTRQALLRLNATIQADTQQYQAWEEAAEEGFDRCVGMAADVAIDFGAGMLANRYDTIYELAKKLPNPPTDLIEKYRHLAELAKRMQQAKATNDLDNLANRENKTDAQIFETIRDGIGQLSSLLGLDRTVPALAWKYGSLTADMAYNLTELSLGFKNIKTLENNQELQRQAVEKLAEQMRRLVEEKKALRAQIEQENQPAGGSSSRMSR